VKASVVTFLKSWYLVFRFVMFNRRVWMCLRTLYTRVMALWYWWWLWRWVWWNQLYWQYVWISCFVPLSN